MIVVFDICFYNDKFYTVGGVFESWASDSASYYITSKKKFVENSNNTIDCMMRCLSLIELYSIDSIIINDFVWFSKDGKELVKSIGAKLNDCIRNAYGIDIDVVGISENKPNIKIPNCFEVMYGIEKKKALFITCSNVNYTEYYSTLVSRMDDDDAMPTMLKLVHDKATRLKDCDMEEKEEPVSSIGLDMSDLDKWAEEAFSIPNAEDAIDKFVASTKEKGFEYEKR